MAAAADFELSREQIRCTVCGGAAERIRYSRTPPPTTFLESALRPTEAVECASCESRDAAVAYQKGFGGEPPKELPPWRRAELEGARAEVQRLIVRNADPEAWASLQKKRRADRRREEALREKDRWFAKVWPLIAPHYGRKGWRELALKLCAKHGITSERQLDRMLEEGRRRSLVPRLR